MAGTRSLFLAAIALTMVALPLRAARMNWQELSAETLDAALSTTADADTRLFQERLALMGGVGAMWAIVRPFRSA